MKDKFLTKTQKRSIKRTVKKSLKAYWKNSCTDWSDKDELVENLLSDLMHYCRFKKLVFKKLIHQAKINFREELEK